MICFILTKCVIFLFSTDLNKIDLNNHIKYIYLKSTRENNSWIYKNDPFKSLHLILNTVLLPDWSTCVCVCVCACVRACVRASERAIERASERDSCSWVPCLSWTVKLHAVLKKFLQVPEILWFSSILWYIWTLSNNDCDFEIHLFTPRTTEGLICSYYRRFKHSLMLQKET